MSHVEIKAFCKGDKMTAITQTQNAVKGYKKGIYLYFDGYSILISPESYSQDLIEIMILNEKIKKLTPPKVKQ